MAAPPEVTITNLSGQYIMNKTLSDDPDAILAMQGVSWTMRTLIKYSTITLYIKHSQEDGVDHIDIEQVGTGGFKGTTENRTLDGETREHEDHIFGKVKGHSRWTDLDHLTVDDPFLKEGWRAEMTEGKGFIESYAESLSSNWKAEQVWGFEDIIVDGQPQRRYVRHVKVWTPDREERAKLVYDYQKAL